MSFFLSLHSCKVDLEEFSALTGTDRSLMIFPERHLTSDLVGSSHTCSFSFHSESVPTTSRTRLNTWKQTGKKF